MALVPENWAVLLAMPGHLDRGLTDEVANSDARFHFGLGDGCCDWYAHRPMGCAASIKRSISFQNVEEAKGVCAKLVVSSITQSTRFM